ncbi:MAG: hypothetical protein JJU20_09880 [Opitutales bacterium]|nr:hypothetical protein [Opitutales bacterium]
MSETTNTKFHLFERYGVELEYMIVDRDTLDVRPIADQVVHAVGNERKNEVKHGKLRWSNELVMHVIELKTDGPSPSLHGLAADFQAEVDYLNGLLAAKNCCLLPTAMHPWMNPLKETQLWPHGDRAIYDTFDRIFGCQGHGWSNLQSTHINLPFSGDTEFQRLHTAIRLVLPLLPALAASSPFVEGKVANKLDMRLDHYRSNCARIPSITGHVIPERVTSEAEYSEKILRRIDADLRPHDPDGILEAEWVNARGAIARFERGTIEIRLLDIQEHPGMDLAIVQFVVALVRALVEERWSTLARQSVPVVGELGFLLNDSVVQGENARIPEGDYLEALNLEKEQPETISEVLWQLLRRVATPNDSWCEPIEFILRRGCLSRRLRRAAGKHPDRAALQAIYRRLADCLQNGQRFDV